MNTTTNGHAKSTTINMRPPKKKTELPESFDVFQIEKKIITCTLVGTSPLIVNNFDPKGIQEMEDIRRLSAEEKRAQKGAPRAPVIPEVRFQAARILDEKGRDCVPARYVKAALVTAATKYKEIGVAGTIVRGALFIEGDLLPIKFSGVKGLPILRRDIVRVGKFPNKQPDLRYRPEYRDWSIAVRIEFEPALISMEGLHHLIRRAGTSVGLCEWRPEKSPAGTFGRFDIAVPQ